MRDDDEESDPHITAPHRTRVTPRTLFDDDDAGGVGRARAKPPASRGFTPGEHDETDGGEDGPGEGARPFPITAIILVAVIAGVLGYVAVRQFLSPGTSRPSLASGAASPEEGPGGNGPAGGDAASGVPGAARPPRPDYFDPLVSPGDAPGGAGADDTGLAGDRSHEADMVPVEPDIPPGGIAAQEPPREPEMPPPAVTAPAPQRASPGSEAEAWAEAARGDYARAARLWAGSLSAGAEPGSWTVQVSANCNAATLPRLLEALEGGGAAGRTAEAGGAFLLPVTINGADCYRVCRGIYPGRSAAEAALGKLPKLTPEPQARAVPLDTLLTH